MRQENADMASVRLRVLQLLRDKPFPLFNLSEVICDIYLQGLIDAAKVSFDLGFRPPPEVRGGLRPAKPHAGPKPGEGGGDEAT